MYSEELNIGMIEPITIVPTGKRGRPRKVINSDFLQEAMSTQWQISLTRLANKLGIHRHTLCYYMHLYDVSNKFLALTDHDLDLLVKTFHATKPDSGIQYLVGFLHCHSLRIQKQCIQASIRHVDGLGCILRRHTTIHRWKYNVSHPDVLCISKPWAIYMALCSMYYIAL